jgi:hypothetical protein
MDAIEILRAEHQAVKAKMFEILRSADADRKSLFAPFKREYELHDGIKTDVFYPAIASNPKAFGLKGMDPEARRVIANALRNLDSLPGDSKDWFPYFRAIQGILKRQIDLEDIKVFEQVREAFGPDVLEELGRRMVDERRRRSIDPDGQATGAGALGVETKLGGKHAH